MDAFPSNWIFDEFVCRWTRDEMTTFAYWLCAIDREAVLPSVPELATAMSTQCDLEEQSSDSVAIGEILSLMPRTLKPLAPVTLTKRWSPFPAACEILGTPTRHDSMSDQHKAFAFATWQPSWLGGLSTNECSEDESHFRYLLRLGAAKADQLGSDLFLSGQIGWSYEEELKVPMNPEVALAMLKYGMVFTDRVPR